MHPAVDVAIEALRLSEIVAANTKLHLREVTEQLDQDYFDLLDASDNDPFLKTEAVHLFSQARAVAALLQASGDDPYQSALEAVYEASMAVGDPNCVFDAVIQVLSNKQ